MSNNLEFDKKRASILAIVALLAGMFIYVILNLTTALVYSPEEVVELDWALGSAVLTNVGQTGFFLLVFALGAAVSSGINGFMICSTKLISAMGHQGVLHNSFSRKNSKGVPSQAIIFVSVISFFAAFFPP